MRAAQTRAGFESVYADARSGILIPACWRSYRTKLREHAAIPQLDVMLSSSPYHRVGSRNFETVEVKLAWLLRLRHAVLFKSLIQQNYRRSMS
jgi:hypothetical protein